MNLWQAHHLGANAALHQRHSRCLGYTRDGWRRKRWIILGGGAALSHSDSGADDEETTGTQEHRADRFNRALVQFTAFREPRPVVPESSVNDSIGRGGPATQGFEVFQIALMDLGARCEQRLRACFAAREPQHLVTCVDEF